MFSRYVISLGLVICVASLWAFDNDTIAFYGFGDGAVGSTVIGTAVRNAVDAKAFVGTPSLVGTGTADDLLFDDDVPGAYVYEGEPTVMSLPVFSGLKSIAANSPSNAKNGGAIDFANLATALSSNEAFTIEFFYKIPTEDAGVQRTSTSMLTFDMQSDVRYQSDPSKGNFAMMFYPSVKYPIGQASASLARPCITTSWSYGNTFRYFNYGAASPYLSDLADGNWHHVAIVCTGSGAKYTLWCDYYTTSSDSWGGGSLASGMYTAIHTPQTIARPLKLFNGIFRGKVAGLRVVKRALALSEFMRAYDFPNYKTVFHYRLDRSSAQVSPVLTNAAPSVATSFANQFCRLAAYATAATMTQEGLMTPDNADVYPVYTNKTWRKRVVEGADYRVNESSLELRSTSWNKKSAAVRNKDVTCNWKYNSGSFTMEAFVYFDLDAWRRKFSDHVSSGVYVPILGIGQLSNDSLCRVFLHVTKNEVGQPYLWVLGNSGSRSASSTKSLFSVNRWHHVALTFDVTTQMFRLYVDYEQVSENDASTLGNAYRPGNTYWAFGGEPTHSGNNPFEGMVDEIRLSRVALTPDEFLKPTGSGLGMTVIFR